jgi:hypothetical protein
MDRENAWRWSLGRRGLRHIQEGAHPHAIRANEPHVADGYLAAVRLDEPSNHAGHDDQRYTEDQERVSFHEGLRLIRMTYCTTGAATPPWQKSNRGGMALAGMSIFAPRSRIPEMSIRPVKDLITAQPTVEGAGVRLRHAFGFGDTESFDPFFLLDDFRTDRPQDYLAGFPWHPNRGIETITCVLCPAPWITATAWGTGAQ